MESLRRSLPRHWLPALQKILRRLSMRFFKAWRNLSGPMGFQKQKQKQNQSQSQNQTLGRDQTASRWSAPYPGKRTRREDHALSHRPQMSSGRLFLDRVARQHCPSPLHRHTQINTHSPRAPAEGDISTLPGNTTFLLCLDNAQTHGCNRNVRFGILAILRCPKGHNREVR